LKEVDIISNFQARETPVLNTVSFIMAIVHIALFGLPLLLCIGLLPSISTKSHFRLTLLSNSVLFLSFCLCPGLWGRKPPQAATKRQINKHTEKKKFAPDLVPKEDAT
jgi:hypothetical protein